MTIFSNQPRTIQTLSVGIPTYNRHSAVLRRVNELTPYINLINEIVICDNSLQVSSDFEKIIQSIAKCHYYKNVTNIGGGANFLRVVEKATSDYIWWRGDDDIITDEQIRLVVKEISDDIPKLILLSPDDITFNGVGIKQFVSNFDKIKVMGWLSLIVLPTSIAKQALPWGYAGVASGWANVTLVLGLFRVYPELQFVVVPISKQPNQFRDIGKQNGLRWSLFKTCLHQFPLTAEILPSKELKTIYLNKWRSTHQYFSWIKTIIKIKIGYYNPENISLNILLPLISIYNIKSTALAVIMYLLSKVPSFLYQIFFSVIWINLSKKKQKEIEFLEIIECHSILNTFLTLRHTLKLKSNYRSDSFL